MKPFDLEAAKAGKPLITRGGNSAKFIAYVDEATTKDKLIVLVDHLPSNSILRYSDDGKYDGYRDSKWNLFMAPTKKTYWAHVWKDCAGVFVGALFATEQLAAENKGKVEAASYTYLKTIQVEIEE